MLVSEAGFSEPPRPAARLFLSATRYPRSGGNPCGLNMGERVAVGEFRSYAHAPLVYPSPPRATASLLEIVPVPRSVHCSLLSVVAPRWTGTRDTSFMLVLRVTGHHGFSGFCEHFTSVLFGYLRTLYILVYPHRKRSCVLLGPTFNDVDVVLSLRLLLYYSFSLYLSISLSLA